MSGEGNERTSDRGATDEPSSRKGGQLSRSGGISPSKEIVILVDASNVAHGKTSFVTQPRIENLKRLLDRLRGYPVRLVALADASLRHRIDQPSELESMMTSGLLEQVPAGTAADDFLWQLWKSYTAQGSRAYIVTNDKFPSANATAESRTENPRIAFMFVGTELIFQPPIETLVADTIVQTPTDIPNSTPAPPSQPTMVGVSHQVVAHDISTALPTISFSPEIESRAPSHAELIGSAIEVIASLTQPPGGNTRRVNFATVSHYLHLKFQGDFVTKFELSKPKDLAEELEKRGLVTISYTNTTMYVEPTLVFEGRIIGRKFPRRQIGPVGMPEGETKSPTGAPSVVTEPKTPVDSLPEVIEVSSRDLGPTVEIPGLDLFLKLVQDSQPKHVFHWWSQRRGETDNKWQLEGDFFFVFEGTTYRLSGRGYRTLGDFVDGRTRGMKAATDPDIIGDPKDVYRYDRDSLPQIWRDVLRFRNLDEDEYRPSEGDIYYFVREKGFSDFDAFLAAERSKPKPPVYV